VQVRRRISKRIRRTAEGINLAADINADVSVNASETTRRGARTAASRSDAEPKERGKENR
jgi:hypothetical protein